MRRRLPGQVIEDFETFISGASLRRMDAEGEMVDTAGKPVYSVHVGNDEFEFHDAELAPPTGVFASNYSRYRMPPQQRLPTDNYVQSNTF